MSIGNTAADLFAEEREASLSAELASVIARRTAQLQLARSERVVEAYQSLVSQIELTSAELKRIQGD